MVYCLKTVLIVLSQNDQSHINVNESVSALMLFASFDIKIHVLFKDAGLSLLNQASKADDLLRNFLKPVSKMVESFEFYDIDHLYLLTKDQHHPLVQKSTYDLQTISLDSSFIQQFDHILHW